MIENLIHESKCFAFDTETTSIDSLEAELVGVSFSFEAILILRQLLIKKLQFQEMKFRW